MAKKINRTKLPKIVQLPSGSYQTKIFVRKDESGKRVYKSITDPDYDVVAAQAAQFKLDKKREKIVAVSEPDKTPGKTLGEAMDEYIASKDAVLSPATVREYKKTRNTYYLTLINLPIDEITQTQIQQEINTASRKLSPKTVRNIHGFLSAVFSTCRPEMKLSTTLPKKIKPDIKIPSEDEMKRVFAYVRDTDMEIPIYLAACCGLRRSEIAALEWENVNLKKKTLTIKEAIVLNDAKEYVRKGTKTTAGKRTIKIFSFVLDALHKREPKTGAVVDMPVYAIYNRWQDIIAATKIQHYRFHDLRHYAVSAMLAQNVPKSYIADYMGHETENMVDAVYGHIMQERKTTVEDDMEKYYLGIVKPICETISETNSDTMA